uniref:Uncharacterized protein n=1 Tax=Arundo donax TaxID=35708 RepID=A0A0A8ZH92_ARUDO
MELDNTCRVPIYWYFLVNVAEGFDLNKAFAPPKIMVTGQTSICAFYDMKKESRSRQYKRH